MTQKPAYLDDETAARTRLEETLEERLRFQKLASLISAAFINLPAGEVEQGVHDALRVIGEYFGADLVGMARLSVKGKMLAAPHVWLSKHYDSGKARRYIGDRIHPNVAAHLNREGSLVFGKLDEYPDWQPESEFVRYMGIKAAVTVKLAFDGSILDVFTVDIIRSPRDWPRDIVPRVQFLGQVLSNALNRKKAEEELERAFEEIRELKDRLQEENIYLRQQYDVQQKHREIVGNSDAIKKVLSFVERVAPADTTVLITGETGTGKGLVARAIHGLSSRKHRPLVTVNCAALPSTIVESELFGRERGAYTGALSRQIGRFEVADGSTIFLDEIGAVSSEVQIKLLQVLQEGKFERLGSSKTTTVDVRVIAATNRDLDKAVHDGSFREDLYYRLNVFPITVPPLRERTEDIPSLVWFFLGELAKRMGKRVDKISRKSMEALLRYPWPGNVRELHNVVEQSMILSKGNTLTVHLPTASKLESSKQLELEGVERRHIIHVLKQTGWRVKGKNGAAEILGINPSTLRFRMKKLGIERPSS